MSTVGHPPEQALRTASAASPGLARRILDVAVATALLIALAPLLVLLAVLVGTTSGRPVLFRQRRVGAGGTEFTLYKFRSMRNGCAGPGVTANTDARVTGTGRLLRWLSLDELPQLWNVLRGDMTLVGPRPEVPHLAERYPLELRWIFRHRPGLTGPCQLKSRAYASALEGRPDPEQFYLTVLVPQRVALDAEFLAHATVGDVLRFTVRTIVYVISALRVRGGRS
ncbi:sugar transferase [Streptomyces justiciae]|uniref:sugar transferase n=1 Tax=Streptomyces justiciae TaxID=2780140 RepID=UPI0018816495|nr:sugar transferase [Streptomyces justiciae]MBE8474524.1 sugar transferase [Streptomyces justiciae]MCW8378917.1 sugar transferase [Streptomyces justiciae]